MIDDGMTVDEVVELLVSCSNVGIPQPVEYFLRDVERRHGRITVASAVTVIASPDSALLVQASRVKGTGLQLIGANTAISEVPAAKVQQLLAAKGLLPIFYAPIPPADVSLSSKSSKPSGRASTKSAEDTTLKYSPLSVTLSRANSLLRQ